MKGRRSDAPPFVFSGCEAGREERLLLVFPVYAAAKTGYPAG
jgi:hypothetical protein